MNFLWCLWGFEIWFGMSLIISKTTKNIFHVHRFISNVCVVSFKFLDVCFYVYVLYRIVCSIKSILRNIFDIEMKNNNCSKILLAIDAIKEQKTDEMNIHMKFLYFQSVILFASCNFNLDLSNAFTKSDMLQVPISWLYDVNFLFTRHYWLVFPSFNLHPVKAHIDDDISIFPVLQIFLSNSRPSSNICIVQ